MLHHIDTFADYSFIATQDWGDGKFEEVFCQHI